MAILIKHLVQVQQPSERRRRGIRMESDAKATSPAYSLFIGSRALSHQIPIFFTTTVHTQNPVSKGVVTAVAMHRCIFQTVV
ncbi:hypothetical protein SADUNF_Sadunf18G0003500 [Salix dunnii]|uniref:Uncharacterized protein n=1 Tax=Salix dunnii TaxID=1413687 RepID=A0A835MLM5_9ROSI|nr:hypothetical protein SADUNF_Sadunf18G0003500 [Salix dunnii]